MYLYARRARDVSDASSSSPGLNVLSDWRVDNALATPGVLFQAAALMPSVTSAHVPATTSIASISSSPTIPFRFDVVADRPLKRSSVGR